MVDYAKLIDEESNRKNSALAIGEAQRKREIEVIALFREVEIGLGEELAQANQELKKRGAETISGPSRPEKDQDKIELSFEKRRPCCRLSLQSTAELIGLTRIHVELLDEEGRLTAQTDYVIEGDPSELKIYKSIVEGFPDHSAEITPAEIAQEIIPGIIRGQFA